MRVACSDWPVSGARGVTFSWPSLAGREALTRAGSVPGVHARVMGLDPLFDRDVGEQRAAALLPTSHHNRSSCSNIAEMSGFFSEHLQEVPFIAFSVNSCRALPPGPTGGMSDSCGKGFEALGATAACHLPAGPLTGSRVSGLRGAT
jgi:hypothetical protein